MAAPTNIDEFEAALPDARAFCAAQDNRIGSPFGNSSQETRSAYNARVAEANARWKRVQRLSEVLKQDPAAAIEAMQVGSEDDRAVLRRLFHDARVRIYRLAEGEAA